MRCLHVGVSLLLVAMVSTSFENQQLRYVGNGVSRPDHGLMFGVILGSFMLLGLMATLLLAMRPATTNSINSTINSDSNSDSNSSNSNTNNANNANEDANTNNYTNDSTNIVGIDQNPNKGATIALGRVATQSSTVTNNVNVYGAQFAVNGGVPTGATYCTHTDLQTKPWWKIDLGATHHIQRVALYNRRDGLGERLQYFEVDVIKNSQPEQCGYFNYVAKTAEVINIMCKGKPGGSEVKITITTTSYLTLCEVEVYKWQ